MSSIARQRPWQAWLQSGLPATTWAFLCNVAITAAVLVAFAPPAIRTTPALLLRSLSYAAIISAPFYLALYGPVFLVSAQPNSK